MKLFKRKIGIYHRPDGVITLRPITVKGEEYVKWIEYSEMLIRGCYEQYHDWYLFKLIGNYIYKVNGDLQLINPDKPDYRYWERNEAMWLFKRKKRITVNHYGVATYSVFKIERYEYIKGPGDRLYRLKADHLYEVDEFLNIIRLNKPDFLYWI